MTATLRFDVVSNGAPARRDLAATRREVDSFGKSTSRVAQQSERSRGKLSRFGGAVGMAAKSFGPLAVAAAGVGLIKFGASAVRAASDTQQAFGAVDAVFGRNAAKVKAWANAAVNDVGLARGEYAQLSATLGASLKNAGIEQFDVKTRGLIKTAADLAAQFGGSTSEAVSALGSLMRGEADPIERYGVAIKQSDVNARLAALGQDKLTGAARKQAEMQARLSLVTKQTKDAQGAFRRESGTLAGQQQRLAANFQNVKDKIGQALIPALSKGLEAVNKLFNRTGPLREKLAGLADKIAKYVGPVIRGMRQALDNARDAFGKAGTKGEGFKKVLDRVGQAVDKLAPALNKHLVPALRGIGTWAGTSLGILDRLAGKLADIAGKIAAVETAAGRLAGKLANLTPAGRLIGGARNLLRSQGEGSLARASGYGAAAPFRAPPISLVSSPNVTIAVDSQAMARLFRVIVRDELQHVGYSRGALP